MERKADLENNLPLLPSAKTRGDEGHTCFHLKELFAILVRVLEMNAKTHVRRRTLVFSQFVRKQKVMNDICGRIIHGHNFSNDKRALLPLHLEMRCLLCEVKYRDLRRVCKESCC